MTKTIAIIDGNSLMHRAFHAVPPAMQAPDGTPTNAAFGFMAMLIKFIEEERPDARKITRRFVDSSGEALLHAQRRAASMHVPGKGEQLL